MNNIYKEPYEKFDKLHEQEFRGTEGMKVTLIDYPTDPYLAMFTGQTASWRPWRQKPDSAKEIIDLLDGIAAGKIWAGQVFEAINFTFLIENISRATTHQLVRVRIGAGFMQESGREGTWNKANFITPLTILENDECHKLYVDEMSEQIKTYEFLRDKGIPPQDVRFMYGHGVAQNMWMTINFRALQEWCSKRLCTTMQWEINTLARQVRDEVISRFPHLGILLKSSCERAGGCKSITNYYEVGAAFNGNKIYYPLEERMCGKAGKYSLEEIKEMLDNETKDIEKKFGL